MSTSSSKALAPRVVIVGAGFGGLAAAKALSRRNFRVTVVDRHNYHLFQPLLYQVATAALSPADIAGPIRGIFRGRPNLSVQLADVAGIDPKARTVMTDRGALPYDRLILATGARHAYFGHDGWEKAAPGLKTIEDATEIRRRILIAFEHAETESDPTERRRLLTFVLVGGGPTGVEMAGAIAELAKMALANDFRSIDPREARIVLIEAGPRLLPTFAPSLSDYAKRALESLGVDVVLKRAVTDCDESGVVLDNERIESRTIIWAAGVRSSPVGKWLDAKTDRAGRVLVSPDLSIPGNPDIFAIGDAAHVEGENGTALPGVAPVAKQEGEYVARLLTAQAEGRTVRPFRYRDPGQMATIGRSRAVAEIKRLKIKGFPAWLLWSFVHIYSLIGFRRRIFVAISWAWSYLTYERGMRLITGVDFAPPAPSETTSAVKDAA